MNGKDSKKHIQQVYQLVVPSLFAAIVVFGIIGNILVIYVILARKRLQTVTNLLLLNLAVSDVAFLLICGGFSIVHYVLMEWPWGSVPCRIIQYLLYVTCYVTVYTLMAVSVVRYVSVVWGMQCAFIQNKRHVIILIIVIWMVFLLAKIPILMIHGVTHNPSTDRTECIISGRLDGQKLFATFFVFAYALPLIVTVTLYLLILRLVHSVGPLTDDPSVHMDRQEQVTKVVLVLVLTFAICWLPLHIHLLVAYYGSIPDTVAYNILLLFCHSLIYLNSMLNPVIYNFFSQKFRHSFCEVVCGVKQPVNV